jgi:hypothetical protein
VIAVGEAHVHNHLTLEPRLILHDFNVYRIFQEFNQCERENSTLLYLEIFQGLFTTLENSIINGVVFKSAFIPVSISNTYRESI